ncbi:hypothetical protein M3J09_002543 [Ascochyta lentis]
MEGDLATSPASATLEMFIFTISFVHVDTILNMLSTSTSDITQTSRTHPAVTILEDYTSLKAFRVWCGISQFLELETDGVQILETCKQ